MTREEFIVKAKYIEEFASMSQDAYEKLEELKEHDQAQREEISRLLQAVGLASTLKPDMEINVNNPVGMMQQVEKHVLKQREEIARLRRPRREGGA